MAETSSPLIIAALPTAFFASATHPIGTTAQFWIVANLWTVWIFPLSRCSSRYGSSAESRPWTLQACGLWTCLPWHQSSLGFAGGRLLGFALEGGWVRARGSPHFAFHWGASLFCFRVRLKLFRRARVPVRSHYWITPRIYTLPDCFYPQIIHLQYQNQDAVYSLLNLPNLYHFQRQGGSFQHKSTDCFLAWCSSLQGIYYQDILNLHLLHALSLWCSAYYLARLTYCKEIYLPLFNSL